MSVTTHSFLQRIFFRSPFKALLLFLLASYVVALAIDWFYPQYLRSRWEIVSANEESRQHADIQSRFDAYQRQTVHIAEQTASSLNGILQRPDTDRAVLINAFETLRLSSTPDLSLEVFDRHKQSLCWAGNRSPSIDSTELQRVAESFVVQGPIYSYLIVTSPMILGNDVAGYIGCRRLFSVNYPINNRFINNGAFAAAARTLFEVVPDFDFSRDAKPSVDQRIASVELKSLRGIPIGYAYVQRPALAVRVDEFRRQVRRIEDMLLVLLFCFVLFKIGSWSLDGRKTLPRVVLFSILLWAFRYVCVWMSFPESAFSSSLFDPGVFSSPFGYGIARTIADMFFSSVVLVLNVGVIVFGVTRWLKNRGLSGNSGSWLARVALIAAALALMLIVFLMMRGVAAVVHSAVFDSTLAYNDPTGLVPSMPLSLMLLSLFLIVVSFVLAASASLYVVFRLVKITIHPSQRAIVFVIVGGMLALMSGVFGIVQAQPLLSQSDRLIMIAGLFLLSIWLGRRFMATSGLSLPLTIFLLSCASGIILVPQMDGTLHQLDRAHVEILASEIVRPVDSWLRFIVNNALDGLSSGEAPALLSGGDEDDREKLAFTQWAKSVLSKEGYNCSVTFVDSGGKLVSDFHVGLPPHLRHHDELPVGSRFVVVDDNAVSGPSIRRYTGFTPVRSQEGVLVGGVWLELSANRKTLLRGEAPEILRNYSKENFETHFRRLALSEYFQGRLVSATREDFPLNREIPPVVREASGNAGVWTEEAINGKGYETYLLRAEQGPSSDSWIALSMESLGFRWHLYSFLRYALFYLVTVSVFLALVLAFQIVNGRRFSLSFMAKLMIAFVTVSLIPVIILAYYNSQYSLERAEESSAKRLSEQTAIVVAELQEDLGTSVPFALSGLSDARCEEIAGTLNADFNVYRGTMLQASSKPEMFTAELLDESLSPEAYVNIVLQRRGFYSENQAIGTFPYVVGYRPLLSEAGEIIGVVAVPSLFRQAEVNEDRTRRSIFLIGAYVVAIIFSIIVGSIFANQISSPVRRLKQATADIASGKLDVRLKTTRRDELGDLERAFSKMTGDLMETQERMLSAERELAWREMAKQVAHEIKNPLTPMKLSIQHLRQAYRDKVKDFDALLEQLTGAILEQIETLSRISSEFSQLAKMPDRRLERCEVHEILREAAHLFQQHQNIRFRYSLDASESTTNADRDELRRAFINIYRNSVQAMGESGTITVASVSAGRVIEIRVNDTGPGIPEEIQARLFEPNFSTKTDGMGLGLSIVRNIIATLGGSIAIASRPGEGTTVVVRLPLASGSADSGNAS